MPSHTMTSMRTALLFLGGAASAVVTQVSHVRISGVASMDAHLARFSALVDHAVLGAPLAAAAGRLYDAEITPSSLSAAASAYFNDTLEATGWTSLHVITTPGVSNEAAAYAAGYAEGSVTALRIFQGAYNQGVNYTLDPKLGAFIAANSAFMREAIQSNGSRYWYQVGLVLIQLQGMFDGYSDAVVGNASMALPFNAFINFQIGGDLEDLAAAIGIQESAAAGHPDREGSYVRVPYSSARGHAVELVFHLQSGLIIARGAQRGAAINPTVADGAGDHCSGVIRLLPGAADVLAGQADWGAFNDMVRVFKRYSFAYTQTLDSTSPPVAAVSAAFSGYPGTLYSADDFYTLSSGLIVWETTIGNSNATLYQLYVAPTTVLDWMRNIVANRIAASGGEWCDTFGAYNSGSYNNQFAVVDSNAFTPGVTPSTGVLFILEQLPGYIRFSDQTQLLVTAGYFGSYNVPFDPFIYVIGGQQALEQQYGPWFSYNATARANILRRDAPGVADVAGFQRLMRYNDFTHDPLSTQACSGNPPYSAENAIAARDDLNPINGVYPISALGHRNHAAIDAKIASAATLKSGSLAVIAQAGPTHDQQPVFSWSTIPPDFTGIGHLGQPDSFNFSFVTIDC